MRISNTRTNIPKQRQSFSPNIRSHSTSSNRTCRNHKILDELQKLQSTLQKNKDKLETCLGIYAMLDVEDQKQRCLEHNNTLSLYCLHQRKIICVNCIYGANHKHRTHRVVPLKDSQQEIQDDNKKLVIIIQNQIKRLQMYSKISNDNKLIFTAQLNAVLKSIQLEYIKKQQELKNKYQQIKNGAKEVYEPLIKINQNLEKQFEDFKNKIFQGTTQFNSSQNRQQQQITKQVLFVNIVELCQVKARIASTKQIQNLNRLFKGPLLSL